MVIDAWELYEQLQNEGKCKTCHRDIIENMETKNGCIWCDVEYHKEKNNERS